VRLFSTSISTRLLLAFALPTAAVFAITGAITYLGARDAFRDEFARKLDVLATTLAAQVDADRVLSLLPGDEQQRWYLDLAAELERQQRAAGLSALYLSIRTARSSSTPIAASASSSSCRTGRLTRR
jgi:hypothetical protein